MSWGIEQYTEDAQVELLAHVAVSWGFGRDPTRNEIERGDWFAGYRGHELAMIYWFERMAVLPDTAGLHYAVSPRARKAWPVRSWLNSVIPFARHERFKNLLAHTDGLPLDYLYRYVDIWNRRHDDVLTVVYSQPFQGQRVVAIDLGATHGS